MKRLLLLLLLLLTTPALAAPAPLIVISIDGFRADYLARGDTPTLAMLARGGVHATAMHPSFPSLTFPNHYTLVTGLYPDHHGIVDNTMWDEAIGQKFTMSAKTADDPRWWEGAKPLWTSAEEQGLITAIAGWPGSEKLIDGHRPHDLAPWRDKRTADEAVAELLNWLDLPTAYRPSILLGYFYEVDHQGHDFGPDSPQVNDALHTVDAALARLVAGLKARHLYARSNIVIVSDHGMTPTPVAAQHSVIDQDIPPDMAVVRTAGSSAGLDPLPGHDAELADILLKPHDHYTCWRKSEIPARLHYGSNPRVPQFICLNRIGWRFATRDDIARQRKDEAGNHGYDPMEPDMQALFVAHGPAFRAGITLAPFDNVDVYGLLARLGGVAPEKNDGDPGVFAPALK